jgi:hypothetical protein
MSTQHNRAVVERIDALVGATDLDALDYLCTPEMVNHSLAPNRSVGLAGTREFLTEAALFGYRAQPGGYSHEVAFIYRLADGRIAERWAVRADLTMLRQLGADQLGTPR